MIYLPFFSVKIQISWSQKLFLILDATCFYPEISKLLNKLILRKKLFSFKLLFALSDCQSSGAPWLDLVQVTISKHLATYVSVVTK